MIAAFLTADFFSSESKSECVKRMLDSLGVTEDVLYRELDEKSKYTEPQKLRRAILDRCHGLMVEGLNLDVIKWCWEKPEQGDVLSLMNYEDFRNWTGRTLEPHDAIERFTNAWPREAMAEAIRSEERMAPCI
jgi:hypothetical protein